MTASSRVRSMMFGAVVLGLMVPQGALAGDFAERVVIGFSKSGSYFAFEQHGVQDGSGCPYSDIFFVDVKKNAWARKPIREGGGECDDGTPAGPVRKRSAQKAAPVLKKLGIVPGNEGTHVIHRPLQDHLDVAEVSFSAEVYSLHRVGGGKISIEPRPLAAPDCPEGYRNGLKVTATPQGGQVQTWQKDLKLPASRGCPLKYRIHDVFVHSGENTVVILAVYIMGFEGPDVRYIAVSGVLPL